jgi:hypothetical protein
MEKLDADNEPLKDRRGRQMVRDIVQFIRFRECHAGEDAEKLAEEVLAEIPGQFMSYVKANGIDAMERDFNAGRIRVPNGMTAAENNPRTPSS